MVSEFKTSIKSSLNFLIELTVIQVIIYSVFYFLFKQNYIQLITESLRLPIEGLIINTGIIVYFIKRKNLKKAFINSLKWSERLNLFTTSLVILAFVILIILILNLYLGQIRIAMTDFNFIKIVAMALLVFLLAGSEEIITRFILFEIIGFNNSNLIKIVISSFIFSLLHIFNPNIGIIAFLNIFLFAIILGILYSIKKSLWLVTILHFVWNYITGCLIGSNLSGIKLYSVLRVKIIKDTIINGGQFGFEGSIILTLLLVFIIVILIRAGILKVHNR